MVDRKLVVDANAILPPLPITMPVAYSFAVP